MRLLLLTIAVLLVGCVDEETKPDPREGLPTCASLGCDNTFCTISKECTCNDQACVACPDSDPDCWMTAD